MQTLDIDSENAVKGEASIKLMGKVMNALRSVRLPHQLTGGRGQD